MAGRPGRSHRGSDKRNLNRAKAPALNRHWQRGTQPGEGTTCPRARGEAAAGLTPQNCQQLSHHPSALAQPQAGPSGLGQSGTGAQAKGAPRVQS